MRSKNVPWFFKPFVGFLMGFNQPKNPILGNTLSGIVEQIGSKVSEFHVGD